MEWYVIIDNNNITQNSISFFFKIQNFLKFSQILEYGKQATGLQATRRQGVKLQ
jgi:hypothetical protein